ncbi:Bifunctional purine biosynthesis protein PurH [Basidiobolus ranarum]|uniref:Bifunctional purine biosynthesis protein PurH n=1 Tax=Basidiobolus ranarum TaxID=34480 RepID=A0ABR2W2D1_9FUNG
MKKENDIQIYMLPQTDQAKEQVDIEIHVYDSTDSKINVYIAFSVFTAVLSTYITGFNIGSPNIPQQVIIGCNSNNYSSSVLPACLPMAPIVWGFTLATFALGSLVAGLSAGSIADRIGRRRALWFNNTFVIIAGVLMSTAGSIPQMIVGRFLAGLGGGCASVFVSMYNSEIAPLKYKGVVGTMTQVSLVSGILSSQGLALLFTYVPGWRILFSLTAIPCILQIVLLFFCTETPTWLIRQGRIHDARASLQKLRKGQSIDNEFDILYRINCSTESDSDHEASDNEITRAKTMGLIEILKVKETRRGLFNALAIHAFQQLCGVNAVIYYSTSIFQSILGPENSGVFTVVVAATNLTITLLSTVLVDRLGRKPLLLVSSFGMCISCILMVIAANTSMDIMVVISVMLFIGFFATGLGPLPWLLVPEFLPPAALGTGASLCSAVNWMFTFLIGFLFPAIKLILQDWAFLPFAITSGCCGLYVLLFFPETKFKNSETITEP